MTYILLPDAEEEMAHAALDYEFQQVGLGWRFRREVDEVIGSILTNPLLWRERPGGYRRVNLPVFPFYIAYVMRGQTIVILAIAHGHRRPGYWMDRLG